jgi:hypothetical protein
MGGDCYEFDEMPNRGQPFVRCRAAGSMNMPDLKQAMNQVIMQTGVLTLSDPYALAVRFRNRESR